MEKMPQFLRELSKENPEDRKKVADALRAKRKEYIPRKKEIRTERVVLEKEDEERLSSLTTILEEISSLEDRILKLSQLTGSTFEKVRDYFKYYSRLKKLKEDKRNKECSQWTMESGRKGEIERKKRDLDFESTILDSNRQSAKKIFDDFYLEQEEKWARQGYEKNDIVRYFSEEHLASLSLRGYSALLRKFPSQMVSHVTRQGVRDHTGSNHMAGLGEYWGGFTNLIEDGRLRSPLGVFMEREDKDRALVDFLRLEEFQDEQSALDYFEWSIFLKGKKSGSYNDRSAIHFAAEMVADAYYGCERGNEIFVAYPAVLIASQCRFSGLLNERKDSNDYNDVWVWENEGKGIDINAGVVCIPEKTLVSPKTGSKYELDSEMRPIINTTYAEKLKVFVQDERFFEFVAHFEKAKRDNLGPIDFSRELLTFGITEAEIISVICSEDTLVRMKRAKNIKEDDGSIQRSIEDSLRENGVLYEKAKDAISSKEFWELYFVQNPDKKPNKIFYYTESPTLALDEFKKDSFSKNREAKRDFGFSENQVSTDESLNGESFDIFKGEVIRVTKEYFLQNKK